MGTQAIATLSYSTYNFLIIHKNVFTFQVIKVNEKKTVAVDGEGIIKFNNERNLRSLATKQSKKPSRNSFVLFFFLCVLQKPFRDKITKRYQASKRTEPWPRLKNCYVRRARRKLIIRMLLPSLSCSFIMFRREILKVYFRVARFDFDLLLFE